MGSIDGYVFTTYVFNAENDASIPDLLPSPYDAMIGIGILNGVKAHKATATDEVLDRLGFRKKR